MIKAGAALGVGGWVLPTVLSLDVPSAMASPGCVVPTLSFTGATLLTMQAGSGVNQQYNGLAPAVPAWPSPYDTTPFQNPSAAGWLLEQDPAAATYSNTSGVTVTSGSFNLTAGSIWSFTYKIRWRSTSNHTATQTLRAQILPPGSSTWVTIAASNNSNTVASGGTGTLNPFTTGPLPNNTGINDVSPNPVIKVQVVSSGANGTTTFPPGAFQFRFLHSFTGTVGTATNARANDVAETFPTITCV